MTNPPICPICGSNMTVIKYRNGYRVVCTAKRNKLRGEPYSTEQAALEAWGGKTEHIALTQRKMFELRHIEGLTWNEVAERLHYSVSSCYRLSRQALVRISGKEGVT